MDSVISNVAASMVLSGFALTAADKSVYEIKPAQRPKFGPKLTALWRSTALDYVGASRRTGARYVISASRIF